MDHALLLQQWNPTPTEHHAGHELLTALRRWYDTNSLRSRTQRITQTIEAMRQLMVHHGPGVAPRDVPVSLGKLIIATISDGRLNQIETFATRNPNPASGAQLLAQWPQLPEALDHAEAALDLLAQTVADQIER